MRLAALLAYERSASGCVPGSPILPIAPSLPLRNIEAQIEPKNASEDADPSLDPSPKAVTSPETSVAFRGVFVSQRVCRSWVRPHASHPPAERFSRCRPNRDLGRQLTRKAPARSAPDAPPNSRGAASAPKRSLPVPPNGLRGRRPPRLLGSCDQTPWACRPCGG